MPSNAETTLPIQTMVSSVCPMDRPRAVYGVRLSTYCRTFISALTWAPLRNMECTLFANKHVVVSDAITSCGIDLLVATESWHQSSSDVSVRRSTPPGYSAVDRPRPDGSSYGGIVIFHRSHLFVRRIPLASSQTTFEALAVSVSSPRGLLTILAA